MSNFESLNQKAMNTYPNLILECSGSAKTENNVKLMIPVLIRWANSGVTTNTYGDLGREIGKPIFSGIGFALGRVQDVMKKLGQLENIEIPSLNALVRGKDGLPSYGFEYINSSYPSMTDKDKRRYVDGVNKEALDFKQWDLILQLLELKPSVVNSKKDEDRIHTGHYFGGPESDNHKSLKEYILSHPNSIGLTRINNSKSECEHILLSGDRLDVYFESKNGDGIAVEVKSIISDDADILRGLYQCVKYKAVLDAQNQTHGLFAKNKAILVIEGSLSESNQQVKDSLGITVIEHFIKEE